MKRTIFIVAATLALTGCAAKRYDSATKIKSETTITQDSTAPIRFESPVIPMAGQNMKQSVGGEHLAGDGKLIEEGRSLNGKTLITVKFIRQDGSHSVLEVVETGERFKVKGRWGELGEVFKLER